jgi:large subunit ribosomal protein L17
MRHRVHKVGFSRNTNERKALIRAGVENLVTYGGITTSRSKAKEFKRWADKLIHKAQADSISARRELHKFFGKRDVVNTIVDRLVPLFVGRTSGFSRIVVVGNRRGDNTEMVRLELVVQPEVKGVKNPEPKKTETKAKVAKPVVKKATPVKAEAKPAAKKATVKKETKKAAPKKAAAKKTTTRSERKVAKK